MARVGINRLKVHTPLKPERITAAVVTFVPEEIGYFQDRLSVIKLSLTSLVKHADLPIDLMVFDNASCPAVVEYLKLLKDEGIIKYLILSSENIGLAGAYRFISGGAPGEVIAFANDDVFYYPGWLSPQMKVLDGLPDVGFVSGFYLRGTHPRSAELAREKGLKVESVPAPDEWMDEFCRDASYGSAEDYFNAQQWQGWTDLEDRLISSNGVSAYAGGVCWQGVLKKEAMLDILPQDEPTEKGFKGYDGYFHDEILRRGYLRLSTMDRFVRHIGNVITPEMVKIAAGFGLGDVAKISSLISKRRHPLVRIEKVRYLLLCMYNWLHRVIHS